MIMDNKFCAKLFLILSSTLFICGTEAQGTDFLQISEDPNARGVKFFFYPDNKDVKMRKEVMGFDFLFMDENLTLDKNKTSKIIVHGGPGNCLRDAFPLSTIKGYLEAKERGIADINIFCIDYERVVAPFNGNITLEERNRYITNLIGAETAKFLQALLRNGYISSLQQVHVIGQGLGGHIAGVIGQKAYESSGYFQKIGRITGLDTGFTTGYTQLDLDIQLDESDADFVDVIHTNAGQLGMRGKFGQVDFYPDGGSRQKFCTETENLMQRLAEQTMGICSHLIVGTYWANSITNPSLIACKADSWKQYQKLLKENVCRNPISFGESTPNTARGRYYLEIPKMNTLKK